MQIEKASRTLSFLEVCVRAHEVLCGVCFCVDGTANTCVGPAHPNQAHAGGAGGADLLNSPLHLPSPASPSHRQGHGQGVPVRPPTEGHEGEAEAPPQATGRRHPVRVAGAVRA